MGLLSKPAGGKPVRVSVEYSEKLLASAQALRQCEESHVGCSQESPGLLLKHYAPSVPSALLTSEPSQETSGQEPLSHQVSRSVLVDLAQRMRPAHKHFMKVFDFCQERDCLEAAGSVEEACSRAFAVLREAEAFAL